MPKLVNNTVYEFLKSKILKAERKSALTLLLGIHQSYLIFSSI